MVRFEIQPIDDYVRPTKASNIYVPDPTILALCNLWSLPCDVYSLQRVFQPDAKLCHSISVLAEGQICEHLDIFGIQHKTDFVVTDPTQ